MFKNKFKIAVFSLAVFVAGMGLSYLNYDILYQNALEIEEQLFVEEAKQVEAVLKYESDIQVQKIEQLQSHLERQLSLFLSQSRLAYLANQSQDDKKLVEKAPSFATLLEAYFEAFPFNQRVSHYFKSHSYILDLKFITRNQSGLPREIQAEIDKGLAPKKIFLSQPYEVTEGPQTRQVASFLAPIYVSEDRLRASTSIPPTKTKQSEQPDVLAGYILVNFDLLAFINFIKKTYYLTPKGAYELVSKVSGKQYFKGHNIELNQASQHFKSLVFPLEIAQKSLVLKVAFNLENVYPEGELARLSVHKWPLKIGGLTALFVAIWAYLLLSINLKERTHNKKLAEEKAVYEKLFKNSVEGYLLLSKDQVTDCNRVSLDAFQYQYKKDLIGKIWSNLSPKFQPDGQNSNVKINTFIQFCYSNERARFEWQFIAQDKTPFWADVILTLVVLDGQNRIHVSWRDISKQKALQKKYILAKEKAEASNAAKTQFIGNISHELRTPIHGILSYAQLGMSRASSANPEKLARYFGYIFDSGDRLSRLLTDLLDLVKFGAGKMRLVPEKTDINALLLSCLEMQTAGFLKKNLSVEWHSEGVVNFMAEVDPARIEQVVLNLLNNAIKFSSDQGGKIQINLYNQAFENLKANGETETLEVIVFSISDEGQGIPLGEEEKIFNQFEQSSQQETGTSGTGLGLSICKEIVKLHSGKIWATNNPVKGACFSVMLPVVFETIQTVSDLTHQESAL